MVAGYEMPFASQMQLTRNAIKAAEPGMGLRVGYQLQLAAHGALGTAMQTAPDLGSALQTFSELLDSRASFIKVALSHKLESAVISIHIEEVSGVLIPFFCESLLATLTHCLAFYTGKRDGVGQIRLGYEQPTYGTDYLPVFGGSIEFGSLETAIGFDANLLALPSPEADPQIFEDSVKRCKRHINQHTHLTTSLNVENFLTANPGKLWKVEEVAPMFAMSKRTLIRKLKEDNTSYQSVRDEVLKNQARDYLEAMSVEATAIALGFADTSSFRRTFKRWFGQTPSEYSANQ